MNKKQVSNLIDEQDIESKILLHTMLTEFKSITGYLWDFGTYISLVEDEAKKQLKIGNTQTYNELHLFLDSIAVNN
jgi:hypothetical protein